MTLRRESPAIYSQSVFCVIEIRKSLPGISDFSPISVCFNLFHLLLEVTNEFPFQWPGNCSILRVHCPISVCFNLFHLLLEVTNYFPFQWPGKCSILRVHPKAGGQRPGAREIVVLERRIPMKSNRIRIFAYAVLGLFAICASARPAAAQAFKGSFTLPAEVRWQSAALPARDST